MSWPKAAPVGLKLSAVPVTRAVKPTTSPIYTISSPSGNCWEGGNVVTMFDRSTNEPVKLAGSSVQVISSVPQSPWPFAINSAKSQVFTFSVTTVLPVFTEPPETLTLEAGIEPKLESVQCQCFHLACPPRRSGSTGATSPLR